MLEDNGLTIEHSDVVYEGGRRVTVGYRLLTRFGHINWHLGMIEALTGAHGTRGTATV
jgi:hypothetical protein